MNESISQTSYQSTKRRSLIKRILKIVGFFVATIVLLFILLVVVLVASPHGRLVLPVKHKPLFEDSNVGNFPKKLLVQGNRIVGLDGRSIQRS